MKGSLVYFQLWRSVRVYRYFHALIMFLSIVNDWIYVNVKGHMKGLTNENKLHCYISLNKLSNEHKVINLRAKNVDSTGSISCMGGKAPSVYLEIFVNGYRRDHHVKTMFYTYLIRRNTLLTLWEHYDRS